MEMKRTLTMNWDGLGDIEDDDRFFESYDRMSAAVSIDLASSGSESDDDEYDDSRVSFATALSSADFRNYHTKAVPTTSTSMTSEDYNVWMAEPVSIKERRKRLLHGMGLSSSKELLRFASRSELSRAVSTKVGNCQVSELMVASPSPAPAPPPAPSQPNESKQAVPLPSPPMPIMLVRSRSDGDMDAFNTKKRKEELIGAVSKQRLTRTHSAISVKCGAMCRINHNSMKVRVTQNERPSAQKTRAISSILSKSNFGAFFLIKNLDTGKEFIVNEFGEDGMWNKVSDIQTGKQLTREEFENSVGYSPVVKELMRRENVNGIDDDGANGGDQAKVTANSYLTKSFRYSKRRGVSLLKNIKGVANSLNGLIMDKERENGLSPEQQQRLNKNSSSQWVKVRQHGKSYKELTALHLCQEIQAHQGSIWAIKFSSDARYLASAGEDRIIHVWEVQECEVMSFRSLDEGAYGGSPFHSTCSSPDPSYVTDSPSMPTEKKKRGKNRKNNAMPEYVYEPENVFSLSEKPICSFKGHLDDVLDLSWSKSQLLLSSSMDKTVRLWDMETKTCLKLFAHNDYVTCIQFNPIDDDYFISGSLDAKVRIWSIPDRQVVDWTDLHEMVTAACYTPDGQGALVGSHKGNCRMYSVNDHKLNQISQIDLQNKRKSHGKKITGFQFSPSNPSDVLITSADSRVRIYDGTDVTHKFRGFRNMSSQIAASYSPDGKHVITASEDSQVYIWKREEPRNGSTGKSKSITLTRSHEHFQCREVSVAIPWHGSVKGDPPPIPVHSKRHSKRIAQQPPLSNNSSPSREDSSLATNGKRHLPPLPKKHSAVERAIAYQDEELAQVSRTDSGIGIGESFTSGSASLRYGDSPSIAAGNTSTSSWSSSWSLFDAGNSHVSHSAQPTAWGLVIVTAGLGGEIRAYQNFGLPVKIGRQTNLFRDHT